MKRSPIKRTGFKRKKPKAKSATWYKRKVVEAFMAGYRGQPCAVCGTTERTCAHHILAKGSHPAHIITPENIIVLCPSHHIFSNHMAAHSKNSFAVERFTDWMKINKFDQYKWGREHEWDKKNYKWKQVYEQMKKEQKGGE